MMSILFYKSVLECDLNHTSGHGFRSQDGDSGVGYCPSGASVSNRSSNRYVCQLAGFCSTVLASGTSGKCRRSSGTMAMTDRRRGGLFTRLKMTGR